MKRHLCAFAALALLAVQPSVAQTFTIDNTVNPGDVGTVLGQGESVLVTPTGQVQGTAPNQNGITITDPSVTNNVVTVDNGGSINMVGANTQGIALGAGSTVNLNGAITVNTGGGDVARGIFIDGDSTVIIGETGTINTDTEGGVLSYGVNILGDGTVTNNGSITARTADVGDDGGNLSIGIIVSVSGTVINNGNITTDGGRGNLNNRGNNAQGILMGFDDQNPDATRLLINNGNISTRGRSLTRGMVIMDNGGRVENHGDISTLITFTGIRFGEGIAIIGENSTGTNTAINTGNILVTGISLRGSAFANSNMHGIALYGDNLGNNIYADLSNGIIDNSGSVSVVINDTQAPPVELAGLYIQGSGEVHNSGDVSVDVTLVNMGDTNGQAIYVTVDATKISNSGTLLVNLDNAVEAGNNLENFFNSGTITTTFTGVGNGVEVGNDLGSFFNSGDINGELYGVNVGGAITGSLNNAGNIWGVTGGINLGNGDANIVNSGLISGGATGIMKNFNSEVTLANNGGTISGGTGRAVDFTGSGGNDMVSSNGGFFTTQAMTEALHTGSGDDTLTDLNGTYTNAGGARAVRMGGGMDTVTLTGTTIIRPDATGTAIGLGGGDDTLIINGFASINARMNGGGATDTLCLNLWGLTEGDISSILAAGGVRNPDGTITLPGMGTFTVGSNTYDWTNFENAKLVAVILQEIPGLTPNQRAIAAALNPAFQSGAAGSDLSEVLTQIVLAGTGAVPSILNQFSPQPFAEMARNSAVENATFFYRQMDHRRDNIFADGFESGDTSSWSRLKLDTSGLEILDPTQEQKIQSWDRRLASLSFSSGFASDVPGIAWGGLDLATDQKYMVDNSKMIESPMLDPNRFGVWLAGQGILADIDQADGDLSDVRYDTASVTAGLDYKVTRELYVGALFNWGYTDGPLNGTGSRFELDTYQGGLYTGYQSADSGWFAHGYVVGGATEYDQSREIAFGTIRRTASSSPEGWQLTSGAKGGYLFDLDRGGNWQIGPSLGLFYTHLEVDGYTETGAGSLNLAVGQQDVDSLRSALGGKLTGRWQVATDFAIVPTVTAEWLHEFLDGSEGLNGAFSDPAAGSFIIQTRDNDEDYGLIGLGVNFLVGDEWSAFVSYDALFNDQYLGHGIGGGARFEF